MIYFPLLLHLVLLFWIYSRSSHETSITKHLYIQRIQQCAGSQPFTYYLQTTILSQYPTCLLQSCFLHHEKSRNTNDYRQAGYTKEKPNKRAKQVTTSAYLNPKTKQAGLFALFSHSPSSEVLPPLPNLSSLVVPNTGKSKEVPKYQKCGKPQLTRTCPKLPYST